MPSRRFLIRFALIAAAAAALASAGVVLAFSEPSGNPPSSDVPAPINVGSTSQEKVGIFTDDTQLKVLSSWGSGDVTHINGNQLWNSGGDLYLQYSGPANGNVVVGDVPGGSGKAQSLVIGKGNLDIGTTGTNYQICLNGICSSDLSNGGSNYWTLQNNGTIANNNSSGNVKVEGLLSTNAFSAGSGYPSGWGGGIHTFDVFAEGTLGRGTNGQEMAGINSSGDGYLAHNLQVDNNTNLGKNLTVGKNISAFGDICTLNSDGSSNACLSSLAGLASYWRSNANGDAINTNSSQNVKIQNALYSPLLETTGPYDTVETTFLAGHGGGALIMKASWLDMQHGGLDNVGWLHADAIDANYFCNYSQTVCNTPQNPSDQRLKKNIAPLNDTLSKIMALNPVSFAWINPSEHNGTTATEGFIAQQVAQVFPEFVNQMPAQGADKNLVGPDGNEYAISLNNTPAFNAYLVGAIKEIASRINIQGATEAEPSVLSTYQGSNIPAISIDASGNVEMAGDVSASGNLQAGSTTHPGGITLFDDATGAPYCVRMHEGQLTQSSGACPAVK